MSVLADKLRVLRAQRQLTFQQLSARCGISVSTLSKIETGQLSPTYEKIVALAQGLGVDVADLFSSTPADAVSGRRGVTRSGQGVRYESPQYVYEMLCSDLTGKQFLPIRARIKAHSLADFDALHSHAGEEFVYVLEGELHVHSEFYEPLVLRAGDSCYFDSKMRHALVSAGARDAEILWVSSKQAMQEPVIERAARRAASDSEAS
ncbi:helix-turn-helix domain-containing protein [Verticiella sediminum]|uniref:Helix-turn-helix domain-containing protein n=1 Tax=Verticiella sediminum TaxID=1247510 RepID=A0A556AMW3_9BURK|nr:helix-turn-helix domain-containing protein [Verticiella sediminum]